MLSRLLLMLCTCLAACSTVPGSDPAPGVEGSPWAKACRFEVSGAAVEGRWLHLPFPGKTPTRYVPVLADGHPAMEAQSQSSASMLRYKLRVEPVDLRKLRFSWKVPALISGADMTDRHMSDSPVRVVLAFDGDRSRWSGRNHMLSELARALTGEEMPFATLMYVWANEAKVESIIPNGRTDRIQKVVLESGAGRLNQWLQYERDIRADYEKAFGEPPGALVGVGVMTDSDNTGTSARAWYGPIQFVP